LQLAGYTHDTDDAAEHMEALEREALAILGITVE
jgi:ssRNA-specific RNase YbeY (16S rRNA maturation enzyme)